MPYISKINVNGITYGLRAADAQEGASIPYVEGPATDAAGVWTGSIDGLTAYTNGLTVIYVPAVAGASGGVTLNLNGLGAVPCCTTNSTALTTHYAAGTPILFTYVDGAFRRADYNTNTTYSYFANLGYANGAYAADSAVYRYQLLVKTGEDTLGPLNNNSNAKGTAKAMRTDTPFDPFGGIFYYAATAAVAAGANIGAASVYYSAGGLDLRYSLNCGTTLTAHKFIYLKVVPQGDGTVKLAPEPCWTQALPSEADGYWYILIGRTYSAYQASLYPQNPVYYHDGTAIREVNPWASSMTIQEIDQVCV